MTETRDRDPGTSDHKELHYTCSGNIVLTIACVMVPESAAPQNLINLRQ